MVAPAHPITHIWLHPRETIRHVAGHDPEYGVLPLTLLAGASSASLELMTGAGDMGPGPAVSALLFAGPLWGLAALYVGGWLLALVGGGLGGRAAAVDIRAAIAWSNVPVIFGAAVAWLVLALVPGGLAMLPQAVLLGSMVWGYGILAASLAAVQHFSLRRAIGSMAAVAVLVAVVPLAILPGIDGLLPDGLEAGAS